MRNVCKVIAVTVASIVLVGCAAPNPTVVIETQYVNIPVPVFPSVSIPDRPVLEIDTLTEEDRAVPGVVVNAYRLTIIQLRDYAISLETLLRAVNRQSEEVNNEK